MQRRGHPLQRRTDRHRRSGSGDSIRHLMSSGESWTFMTVRPARQASVQRKPKRPSASLIRSDAQTVESHSGCLLTPTATTPALRERMAQTGIIGVEHGHAGVGERFHQLALGLRDGWPAPELTDMGHPTLSTRATSGVLSGTNRQCGRCRERPFRPPESASSAQSVPPSGGHRAHCSELPTGDTVGPVVSRSCASTSLVEVLPGNR